MWRYKRNVVLPAALLVAACGVGIVTGRAERLHSVRESVTGADIDYIRWLVRFDRHRADLERRQMEETAAVDARFQSSNGGSGLDMSAERARDAALLAHHERVWQVLKNDFKRRSVPPACRGISLCYRKALEASSDGPASMYDVAILNPELLLCGYPQRFMERQDRETAAYKAVNTAIDRLAPHAGHVWYEPTQ